MPVPQEKMKTKSGAARRQWEEHTCAELREAASHLRAGLELMRDLEAENDGMKGLSFLRPKGNDVQAIIDLLEEEARDLSSPPEAEKSTEYVNADLAGAVAEARS